MAPAIHTGSGNVPSSPGTASCGGYLPMELYLGVSLSGLPSRLSPLEGHPPEPASGSSRCPSSRVWLSCCLREEGDPGGPGRGGPAGADTAPTQAAAQLVLIGGSRDLSQPRGDQRVAEGLRWGRSEDSVLTGVEGQQPYGQSSPPHPTCEPQLSLLTPT